MLVAGAAATVSGRRGALLRAGAAKSSRLVAELPSGAELTARGRAAVDACCTAPAFARRCGPQQIADAANAASNAGFVSLPRPVAAPGRSKPRRSKPRSLAYTGARDAQGAGRHAARARRDRRGPGGLRLVEAPLRGGRRRGRDGQRRGRGHLAEGPPRGRRRRRASAGRRARAGAGPGDPRRRRVGRGDGVPFPERKACSLGLPVLRPSRARL